MKTMKTPPASIVVTKKAKKAPPPKPGTKEGDAKPAAKTLDKAMEQLKDLKLVPKKAPKGPSSQASRAEDMEFLNGEIAKNEASLKEVAAKENEETLKQATLGMAKDEIKKVYVPEGELNPKYTSAQVSGALSVVRERIFREITLGGTRIDSVADLERLPDDAADVVCLEC